MFPFPVLYFEILCHTFSLIKKKKTSMRWKKSVRALMINRDIFLTGHMWPLSKVPIYLFILYSTSIERPTLYYVATFQSPEGGRLIEVGLYLTDVEIGSFNRLTIKITVHLERCFQFSLCNFVNTHRTPTNCISMESL